MAQPPAPAKPYTKVQIDGKGWALRAARDIKPGEPIIAETPLLSCPPIQCDIIYSKHWLVPGKNCANGNNTIAAAIRRLTPADKRKFRRLHGTSPRNDGRSYSEDDDGFEDHDLSRVRLNSFQHSEKQDGLEYSVERVFEVTSRINHSCKPNAVWSWNKSFGQGTVHAIMAIAEGTEITINYYPTADVQYLPVRERCKKLKDAYGFVCTCSACGPEQDLVRKMKPKTKWEMQQAETDLERDMRLRSELRQLEKVTSFGYTASALDAMMDPEQAETQRQQQLRYLDHYLAAMPILGIWDARLANVHCAKSEQLQLGVHLRNVRTQLGRQAPANLPRCRPETLLREALRQMDLCHDRYLRCCGQHHPDTLSAAEEVVRLKVELMQHGA